ncbi:tRNA (guanosine(46)-N7)-methyltransferase TrmB [candidate division KSB1 bacterium]|nr:tRNA (guanosine(46)-N7)-methyltransferase TrmB [candidate division KSB1 bacterium]
MNMSWIIDLQYLNGEKNWQEVFGNQNPLKVDLGCGYGHFLAAMAQNEPGANFIGIDVYAKGIQRANQKIQTRQLPNVRLLQMNALAAFSTGFCANQLDAIYINFPDPWPKRRHARRRMLQPELIKLLHDRLVVGGRIVVATDLRNYAQDMLRLLLTQPGLQSQIPEGVSSELADRVPTLYEEKFHRLGLAIYYVIVQKL